MKNIISLCLMFVLTSSMLSAQTKSTTPAAKVDVGITLKSVGIDTIAVNSNLVTIEAKLTALTAQIDEIRAQQKALRAMRTAQKAILRTARKSSIR